jgi:SAM-dependent methyltransferase
MITASQTDYNQITKKSSIFLAGQSFVSRDMNRFFEDDLRVMRGEWSMDLDRISNIYDEEIVPVWGRPFSLLLKQLLPPVLTGTVLEVGCGSGYLTVELSERLDEKGRIIAIEPYREMLEIAFRRCEQAISQKKVFFQHHDLGKLHFADGVINLIYSNLGLFYVGDPAAILMEWLRILRSGGRAYFTLPLRGSFREFFDPVCEYLLQQGERELVRQIQIFELQIPSHEEALYLFRRVGFEDVSISLSPFQMIFADGYSLLTSPFIRYHFIEEWRHYLRFMTMPQLLDQLQTLFDWRKSTGKISFVVKAGCLQGSR